MIRCLTAVGMILLAAVEANAAPIFYGPSAYAQDSDSPFSGGSFDYFYLENFEDGSFNTPGVSMSFTGATQAVVTSPGEAIDSVDGDDGNLNGRGRQGHSLFLGGPDGATTVVTFTFDDSAPELLGQLPTSAGLVWTDSGRPNTGDVFGEPGYGFAIVSFEAFDALGISLGIIGPSNVGDGRTDGLTGEDRFFGAYNADGISKIALTINSADWEMDHLQYGGIRQQTPEVPEPSSMILALIGTIGGYTLKRRRTTATV